MLGGIWGWCTPAPITNTKKIIIKKTIFKKNHLQKNYYKNYFQNKFKIF